MKPRFHAATSGVMAAGFYAVSSSIPGVMVTFMAGTAIDINHFKDYALSIKRQTPNSALRFDPRELWSGRYFERGNRLYILLHAWEWLPLLAGGAWWISGSSAVAWGVAASYGLHLLLDQLKYPLKPTVCFLIARLQVGFALDAFTRKRQMEY